MGGPRLSLWKDNGKGLSRKRPPGPPRVIRSLVPDRGLTMSAFGRVIVLNMILLPLMIAMSATAVVGLLHIPSWMRSKPMFGGKIVSQESFLLRFSIKDTRLNCFVSQPIDWTLGGALAVVGPPTI